MRYIAFAYKECYPQGGANDIVGMYKEVFEATKAITDLIEGNPKRIRPTGEYDEAHIFDTHEGRIVWNYIDGGLVFNTETDL